MTQRNGTELGPILQDALRGAIQRLIQGGRDGVQAAADASRTRLEIRQAHRDLEHFWIRLGKTTYHLAKADELDHPALVRAMEHIDDLEARIEALRRGESE